MVMKWTQTLIPTARQVPGEAEVPSHQLMLRAGYIRRLGAGVYDYLPLGLRALKKVMAIVREEMDVAGAVEVFLPTLQPVELWEQTGRRTAYGENLFVVTDRHGREQALGPTHEEVVTELVGGYVESYKHLPVTLYQIQTKFRDEFRPRFGVLRSREFQMKDAYSFHLSLEGPGGLDETYQKQFDAYCRIFSRCGLPYEVVEAESGPIGGSASHEFMVPSPTGEDMILKSDKGNYAANVEKCEIGDREYSFEGEPTGELEKVHTPGCTSIEDVCAYFKKELKTKLKPQNMLKTLVYKKGDAWLLAVVRGDHDVNEAKLRAAWGEDVVLADEAEAKAAGFAIGFVGPHAIADQLNIDIPAEDSKRRTVAGIAIDIDAVQDQFWVAGANEVDHHVKHFNWTREFFSRIGDPERMVVGDLRNAADGDPSPLNDGGVLRQTKGIEIGHVFKLGDKYTRGLDVTVLDENNQRVNPIMGCYGIGINRILASAIERDGPDDRGHDENGIIWPASIAPYAVVITPIKYAPGSAIQEATDRIASELETHPKIDVLIDDRDERPGVKFKDADLIGIPVRITIGDKALANGQVEVKPRREKKAQLVAVDDAAKHIADLLGRL